MSRSFGGCGASFDILGKGRRSFVGRLMTRLIVLRLTKDCGGQYFRHSLKPGPCFRLLPSAAGTGQVENGVRKGPARDGQHFWIDNRTYATYIVRQSKQWTSRDAVSCCRPPFAVESTHAKSDKNARDDTSSCRVCPANAWAGRSKPSRTSYCSCWPVNTFLWPGAARIGRNTISTIANLTT